jgi:hypothetical protein
MTMGDDWGWGACEAESEKIFGDTIGKHSPCTPVMVPGTKFGFNVFPGNPNYTGFDIIKHFFPGQQWVRRIVLILQ